MARRLPTVAVALIVAACGASPAHPTASPTAAGATPPSHATSAALTPRAASPAAGTLPAVAATPSSTMTPGQLAGYGFQMVLLARAGDWALALSDGATAIRSLPAGVPTADWGTIYTATVKGATTQIDARFVEDASFVQSWSLDGAWAIPTIGLARTPTGLSADGRTLVLVDAKPAAGQTHFAILGTQSSAAPRIVSLSGRYTFDAISPDGSRLYAIEYPDAGSDYFVRSVNASTGSLEEGSIVDKRSAGEVMAGTALQQQVAGDGTVLTLYQGPEHPFVHVLQTADRTAWCIDLPDAWGNQQAAAADWGVALSTDRGTLYLANPALGVAGEVDLNSLQVIRTASFAPTAGVAPAKFGGGTAGPATGAMVLSRDGGTLYVADASGVLLIPTSTLRLAARIVPGTAVVSLGMADNGTVMYAVGRDGTAYRVDAASGQVISTLDGGGYTRVLRVITPS